MKGNDQVIAILNELLTNELTSVNQYFIHAKMCGNWGYQRLAQKVYAESIDEMKHADQLIERILYLEGLPNLQRLNKVMVGQTVTEQLTVDLDTERNAIAFLNEKIEVVRGLGDHGSYQLLIDILRSEEDHADWLETQLEQVKQMGEAHYLAQQVRE